MSLRASEKNTNTRIGKVERCIVVSSISQQELKKEPQQSWVEKSALIQPNIKQRQ